MQTAQSFFVLLDLRHKLGLHASHLINSFIQLTLDSFGSLLIVFASLSISFHLLVFILLGEVLLLEQLHLFSQRVQLRVKVSSMFTHLDLFYHWSLLLSQSIQLLDSGTLRFSEIVLFKLFHLTTSFHIVFEGPLALNVERLHGFACTTLHLALGLG